MPGKTTKRETVEFTTLVNQIVSEANFVRSPAVYGDETDGNGKKVVIKKAEASMVPFTYFSIKEGHIAEAKHLNQAIADIIHNGHYALANVVADINYGLQYRKRADYQAGIDPSLTPAQRQAVENLRPLVAGGVFSMELAIAGLVKTGLSEEDAISQLT